MISLQVIPSKPLGLVVYNGPSMLDGEPIVAIASGLKRSKNVKTGKMIQVWIMRSDIAPQDAVNEGEDKSVCGDCFHRHARSCYVNIAHGPNHVYKAFKNGRYGVVNNAQALEHFRDRSIRFGAYGDLAAVPTSVWASIAAVAKNWTGYTHQWKKADTDLKKYCMASCDTIDETVIAKSNGWKPFFVRDIGEELPDGFFECPASEAAGKRLTCTDCTACKGGEYRNGQGMPSIELHGVTWKISYGKKARLARLQKKAWMNINAA